MEGQGVLSQGAVLRNRIEDSTLLNPLIEGDLNTIQKITVGGKDQWLLFPARLYCGQSLLDSRRESIIIDYFFTDEMPGYRQRPDYLAGRNGLKVRDEIRMVRPGLYLGRAYIGRVFLSISSSTARRSPSATGPGSSKTGAVQEDCWTGTQARATVAAQVTRGARAAGSRAMRRWLLVALAVMAAQRGVLGAASSAPRWAVDPTQPGPDAPPAGRSLFDFVATTAVRRQARLRYSVPVRAAG